MYNVTDKYKEFIQKLSRTFKARIVIGNQSFNERDIISLELDEGLGTGDNFMPGGGYINALSVEIGRIIEGLKEDTKVQAFVSLLVDNDYVEVPLGVFFIKEIVLNRNSKRTKLEMQDGMYRLNGVYNSSLPYPTTTRKIVEEIAKLTEVVLAPNLDVVDVVVTNKLEKTTVREALVYIAQLNASFVRFDRLGRLEFIKLTNSKRKISKSNYFLNGLEKNEVLYRVDGMTNELANSNNDKVVLKEGSDTGNVIALNNPLINQTNLSRIYNEYRKLNYYPYTLKWQGDMALFSGEWVNVESYDGQYIGVPILSQKLSFNGGLSSTISARASTTSKEVKEYRGTLTQRVEYLDALVSNQGAIYADVAEPTKPKNGDVWFMPNGGTVTLKEYANGRWITKADTADLDKIVKTISTDEVIAKKISAAVAQIIEINANKIVAGDIDLNRIRIMQGSKEVLTVRDGKVVIDVSNANDVSEALSTLSNELSKKADKQETHTAIEAVAQVSKKTTETLKVNKEITDAQYKVLTSQLALAKQELEAKASLETIRDWQASYNAFVKAEGEHKAEAERNLVALSNRMVGIQNNLGNMTETWNSVRANMTFGEEGLTIGAAGSTTNIFITNERISMMSSGNEVMYISQGVIHIDNGVFTKTLQVGHYIESQYSVNPKYNVIRYVEKI